MTARPTTSPRAQAVGSPPEPPVAEAASLARAPATPVPHTGLGWRPGLDGLRALAVAAVFAYHSGAPWATGGFLGVDVFFVLSGYLITSLLLDDWTRNGRVDLVRFWVRRARRLLPALGFLLLGTAVVVPLLAYQQVGRLPADLAAAAGYVSNWRLIFENQSYFEAVGRPPVLQHLWSLAVEEQFYLVWPVVLAAALRLWRPRWLVGPLLIGAGCSALLMAALYEPFEDPSRVYYGTDTRAAALLVGAALACALWRLARAGSEAEGELPAGRGRNLWSVAGGVGVVVLAWCVAAVDEFDAGLYRGGFLAVALVAAVVVAAAAQPERSWFNAALGCAPLVWVGKRSYAIYLWFWPVLVLSRPHLDVPFDGPGLWALQVGLTVVLADVSYRFVERPLRESAREAPEPVVSQARPARTHRRTPMPGLVTAAGALAASALLLAVAVNPGSATIGVGAGAGVGAAENAAAALQPASVAPAQPAGTEGAVATTVGPTPPAAPDPPPAAPVVAAPVEAAPPPAPPPPPAPAGVWAVGDSVMAGARAHLEEAGISVDAAVGRQFPGTVEAIDALVSTGALQGVLVVQIGNNGPIGAQHVDQVMEAVPEGTKVVWVTVRVRRAWEDHNNEVLAEAVAGRWAGRALLADWYAVGADNPDAFYSDGLHLTPLGRQLYTELLLRTMA